MISRRLFLVAGPMAGIGARALAAPTLAEDGLYYFDWYMQSFLDLAEDIATAHENRKRLAILWSQRACPYCKRMAEEHLSDPAIVDYIHANFEILHFDLHGEREVTDFDGQTSPERKFAQKYGVRMTPTFQFLPETADGLAKLPPIRRESARMPGLLEPKPFLEMFRFVREKGYESGTFQNWFSTRS